MKNLERDANSDSKPKNNLIYETLLAERDVAKIARNFEVYVEIEKKLQLLEALEVERLELRARKWEARVKIANAKKQLNVDEPNNWTESTIKEKYKTIKKACESLNIEAKTWKEAAEKANKLQSS